MFTDGQNILKLLTDAGLIVSDLTFIPRGVMTDKYSFSIGDKRYIIRCFQHYRPNQPEIEFRYLTLFQQRGIKAPKPFKFSSSSPIPYIIYEMLPGEPMTDCLNSLSTERQKELFLEIADNYLKIAEIQNKEFGRIQAFDEFSHRSWKEFIMQVIEAAETRAEKLNDDSMKDCCRRMRKFALSLPETTPNLIWSDFSSDNIIIDSKGKLSGFIDFEGLLSGDPMLGIGYFLAHENNQRLIDNLRDTFQISDESKLVDFYSLIRWCRLLPYQHLPLLNGEKREPLKEFLPNAYSLIDSFGK